MKTKLLLLLAVFSMISYGGIAQGLENESRFGFAGYTSFLFSNNYEPFRNPNHGNERKFNFTFIPSSENGSQGVSNKMTCTDDITTEQVELIFEMVKEFPEGSEFAIAFKNHGRVSIYGLKRHNNSIINIDNHSSVLELTKELTFNMNENEAVGSGWDKSKVRPGGNLYRHKGVKRGYTLAMATGINNETGIIILSNVSGFGKKMRNIDILCFDLLATTLKDNYCKTEPQSNN